MCLQAIKKRHDNEYNDPDALPKANKADMAGTMESIERYLRLHHGVVMHDESSFTDEKPKASKRKILALERSGSGIQGHTDT